MGYNIDSNAHYFVPMCPSLFSRLRSDDERPIECEVIDIDGNYKITLRSVDPLPDYDGTREFYQCDFVKLIELDIIVKKTNPNQYMRKVSWEEPLCGNIKIVHQGWILDEK